MKHSIQREEKFTPITLTITIESQSELDAMGGLFNHAGLNDLLEQSRIDATGILESLGKFGFDASIHNPIFRWLDR